MSYMANAIKNHNFPFFLLPLFVEKFKDGNLGLFDIIGGVCDKVPFPRQKTQIPCDCQPKIFRL